MSLTAPGSITASVKLWLAAAVSALVLSGCAGHRPPPHPYHPKHLPVAHPAPPPPRPSAPTDQVEHVPQPTHAVRFAEIPGWRDEDHIAALRALRAACIGPHPKAEVRGWASVCLALEQAPHLDANSARQFFETHFRAEALRGEGVLTAYFTPLYAARSRPDDTYTAPVRPPPAASARIHAAPPIKAPAKSDPKPPIDDGVGVAPEAETADPLTGLIASSTAENQMTPNPREPATPLEAEAPEPDLHQRLASAERAAIDRAEAPDALAWMRPEDLFFMQIQGSGVLEFDDGRRLRAVYAGDNGKPFVPISRAMVREHLLPEHGGSGDSIHAWLAAHPGPAAAAVMAKNPRYVFFFLKPDDGREPKGAAGVSLPPGRALAVDLAQHELGELYWVDAEAPILTGAIPRYHRVAAALDTGGAIRGGIRADLYLGVGETAGREAGRVRHLLRLTHLIPLETPTREASDDASSPPGRP